MGLKMVPARKSVWIVCGAHLGGHDAYAAAATALGEAVAGAGLRLVYAAGDAGLSAVVAGAAAAAGGESLGVVPAHLTVRAGGGVPGEDRTLVVTETMHERKKVMFMNADAVVVLPGGAGTLDQMLEVLTWRQLGLHRKPLFLLNVEGYWDPFLGLLDHMVASAFAEPNLLRYVEPHDTVAALVDRLSARLYRRPLAKT